MSRVLLLCIIPLLFLEMLFPSHVWHCSAFVKLCWILSLFLGMFDSKPCVVLHSFWETWYGFRVILVSFVSFVNVLFQTQGDYLVIHNVARILELVVPLMEHPSESFLANLEESLMKLTVKHGQTVSKIDILFVCFLLFYSLL